MDINFRAFKKSDFSELKEMIFSLYCEDPEGEVINESKINKTVEELLENPIKGRIIIFEVDEIITGYSIIVFYWSNEYGGDFLQIDELYVKPEWRNKGIGTSFFEFLLREYKENKVALSLEVTPANNKAIEYYRKIGFEKSKNIPYLKFYR